MKKSNIPHLSSQEKNEHTTNSVGGVTLQTLVRAINRKRAESFLVELLNLPELEPYGAAPPTPDKQRGEWYARLYSLSENDLKAARRFCTKFPEFMPNHLPEHPRQNVITNLEVLQFYKRQLHDAWVQPTAIMRQVFFLVPLSRMIRVLYEPLDTPPEQMSQEKLESMRHYERFLGSLIMVFLHGLNIADRLRFCSSPGCPAPHFIATMRRQKYCSETCALPAQRQFKRQWWAEHGLKWQRERRAKAKRKRTQ